MAQASGPVILDGKVLQKAVGHAALERSLAVERSIGRRPGLATVLVGENAASRTYVASKQRFARASGLETFDSHLPADIPPAELRAVIEAYNRDDRVDGILLQLPLPGSLSSFEFVGLISPDKDADGLHPLNQGLLLQGVPAPRPCTPLGTMTMIDLALSGITPSEDVKVPDLPKASLAGMQAIVIGRSQLVGKPMAFLLLERNATVTLAHSKTRDLPARCREADIVVAAVGSPELVRGDWIKPGAIVLDVGINRLPSGKLVGDVAYAEVVERASAITPVPGGIGPMTVAMLISNTVENCIRRTGIKV